MSGRPGIVLGTNYHAGNSGVLERQNIARESLRALDDCRILNLQFRDHEPKLEFDGVENRAELRLDSVQITKRIGPRKPILAEILNVLCGHASSSGFPYFAFTNSDIIITQQAIDLVTQQNKETYVFCRGELKNASEAPSHVLLYGADVFVFRADWWLKNGWRFRPYIVGEPIWDNVFAAIMMCHSDGMICNREPLILHVSHPASWGASPFSEYNGILSALDSPYFSMWARYLAGLDSLRRSKASPENELSWQRDAFSLTMTATDRLKQFGRSIKYKALCLARHYPWKVDFSRVGSP